MIYRLAPSRATGFSEVWLDALAATLLIWIYLSSCVCVFGICFCAALAVVRPKADGSLQPTSG